MRNGNGIGIGTGWHRDCPLCPLPSPPLPSPSLPSSPLPSLPSLPSLPPLPWDWEPGGLVLVDAHVELVDGRRHLEAHQHDLLHALQADILGPLDEARQVALGLDVAADAVVARRLLEQPRIGGRCRQRSAGSRRVSSAA